MRNSSFLHAQKKERHIVARVHHDVQAGRMDRGVPGGILIKNLHTGGAMSFSTRSAYDSPWRRACVRDGSTLPSPSAFPSRVHTFYEKKHWIFLDSQLGPVCDATSQGSIKIAGIATYMARTLNASNRLSAVSITMPVMRLKNRDKPVRTATCRRTRRTKCKWHTSRTLERPDSPRTWRGALTTWRRWRSPITWCTMMEHDVAAQILANGTVDLWWYSLFSIIKHFKTNSLRATGEKSLRGHWEHDHLLNL